MPEGKILVSLTLNPAIDRIIELEELRVGEMNRITESESHLAGKGYHVALVNQILGGESFCIGFSSKNNRAMTENYFIKNCLPNEFVEVSGDLRVNLKIFDALNKSVTEINDKGAAIVRKDLENLLDLFNKYLEVAAVFVFAGSLPPGVNPGIYRDLITAANQKGCITVLAAEGLPLSKGLQAKPYFVKANTYEIKKTFGKKINTPRDAAGMCKNLVKKGVTAACITLGNGGAVLYRDDSIPLYAPPPASLGPGGTVGAGDSLVGAICHEIINGSPLEEMLRSGVAAASAKVVSENLPFISKEAYLEFREEVIVKPVEPGK